MLQQQQRTLCAVAADLHLDATCTAESGPLGGIWVCWAHHTCEIPPASGQTGRMEGMGSLRVQSKNLKRLMISLTVL